MFLLYMSEKRKAKIDKLQASRSGENSDKINEWTISFIDEWQMRSENSWAKS